MEGTFATPCLAPDAVQTTLPAPEPAEAPEQPTQALLTRRPRRRAAEAALENVQRIHEWENARSNSRLVREAEAAIDAEFARERKRKQVRQGAAGDATDYESCDSDVDDDTDGDLDESEDESEDDEDEDEFSDEEEIVMDDDNPRMFDETSGEASDDSGESEYYSCASEDEETPEESPADTSASDAETETDTRSDTSSGETLQNVLHTDFQADTGPQADAEHQADAEPQPPTE